MNMPHNNQTAKYIFSEGNFSTFFLQDFHNTNIASFTEATQLAGKNPVPGGQHISQ